MKGIIAVLTTMLIGVNIFAQSSQKLAYKTTVKDKDGVIVANKPVTLKISLIKGTTIGNAVFVETQHLTTDATGATLVQVGSGELVSGSFKDINLADDTYFIRTEIESLGIIKMSKVRKSPPLDTTNIATVHKKPSETQNKNATVKTNVTPTKKLEADTTLNIHLPDSLKKVVAKKRLESERKIENTSKKDSIKKPVVIHKTDSTITAQKKLDNERKAENVTKKDSIKKPLVIHKKDSVVTKKTLEKKQLENKLKVENTPKKDSIKKPLVIHKTDSVVTKKALEKKQLENKLEVENTSKKDSIKRQPERINKSDNTVIIVKKKVPATPNAKHVQEADSIKKTVAVPKKDTLQNTLTDKNSKISNEKNNLPKTDSINKKITITTTTDSLKTTLKNNGVDKKITIKDTIAKKIELNVTKVNQIIKNDSTSLSSKTKTNNIITKDTLQKKPDINKDSQALKVDSAQIILNTKKSFLGKNKRNKNSSVSEPVTINNNLPPPVSNNVEFKTVIKNINGVVFADAPVVVKLNIIKDSVKGKSMFSETHVVNTDADGIVKFTIGKGIPIRGSIDSINWKNETYFIRTETKPTGVSKIDSAKNVIIIATNKKDSINKTKVTSLINDSIHHQSITSKENAPNGTNKPTEVIRKADSAIVKSNDVNTDSLINNNNLVTTNKSWEASKNKLKLQTEAIENNRNDINAYYTRGIIKNKLQDYRGAVSDFSKVIGLDSNHTEAYTGRGIAKTQLKNYKGAIEDFDKAIKLNPDFADAYAQRGVTKTQIGETDGVLKDFNKAIELAPDSAEYYSYRGTFKSNMKDYRGAISDYTKSIAKNPNNALTFYNRGNTECLYKNDIGAIEDFGQAIKLNPDNANAYYKRGNAKANLKDIRGAILDYDRTIQLDSSNLKAYYNAGIMKTELKEYEDAMHYFNKIILLDSNWSSAYFSRGVTKINLGQIDSGCLDLSKAGELGYSKAYDVIQKHCN